MKTLPAYACSSQSVSQSVDGLVGRRAYLKVVSSVSWLVSYLTSQAIGQLFISQLVSLCVCQSNLCISLLSVCLSVCLSVSPSVRLSTLMPICQSVRPPVSLFTSQTIHLSILMNVDPSVLTVSPYSFHVPGPAESSLVSGENGTNQTAVISLTYADQTKALINNVSRPETQISSSPGRPATHHYKDTAA